MTRDALDELFEQDPPTLGPATVAERLNTTTRTIYTWLNHGVIPGYKVGTGWFILRDELKDSLRQGANNKDDNASAVVSQGKADETE